MTSDVKSLTLADCVELGAVVLSYYLAKWVFLVTGLLDVLATTSVGLGLEPDVIFHRLRESVEILIRQSWQFLNWPWHPAMRRSDRLIFWYIISYHLYIRGLICKNRLKCVMDEAILLIIRIIGIEHLHYITFAWFELLLKEGRQIDFTHKTYSLRILLVSWRKISFCSQSAHLWLRYVTYWKERLWKLILSKLAEEIALVLIWICTSKNAIYRLTIRTFLCNFSAIMACCHHIRSHFQCTLEECIKLNLAVAEHVRIGCAALLIFIEHIVNHPCTIFLAQIHKIEWDSDLTGHHLCNKTVLFPFAIAVKGCGCIVPVLHEESKDIIALLLQKKGCNAWIYPSREADTHFNMLIVRIFHYICMFCRDAKII